MNERQAIEVVGTLLAAFPSARVNEATVALYRRKMAPLDYETAMRAVDRCVDTERFFPSLAAIKEAYVAIEDGPPKAALQQWGSVQRACAEVGYYRVAKFTDPVTTECVAALGWQRLCHSDNETSDRARFVELYRELSKQRQTQRQTGELPAALPVRLLNRVGE